MNCQDIARILDEQEVESLLATELSDAQAHLATCRDCARDWQIHAQLAQAEIPAVPAELRAHYASQAAGVVDVGARRRSRFILIGTFVAVAAAAAMLTLQMTWSPAPVDATDDPVQAIPVHVEPTVRQVLGEVLPWPTEPMSEDESRAEQEWMRRVAEWLTVRDDPDSLITAALLLRAPSRDDQRIQPLLRRATTMAPESARINALAMLLCLAVKDCDATPYEQALRRLAPDNALGWAEEVKRALQAGDQEALGDALTAMSRAKTFDLYWNPSIVSTASRITAAIVAPPNIGGSNVRISSEVEAIGLIAAMPIPAFSPLTKFCKSATDEQTLLECHQIGAAMRAGDTVIVNSIGLTLSGYGLPADSAEARSLAQQRNQITWILRQSGLIAEDDPRYPRVLAEHPREIDSMRAFLEERGMPTEPPEGWKP